MSFIPTKITNNTGVNDRNMLQAKEDDNSNSTSSETDDKVITKPCSNSMTNIKLLMKLIPNLDLQLFRITIPSSLKISSKCWSTNMSLKNYYPASVTEKVARVKLKMHDSKLRGYSVRILFNDFILCIALELSPQTGGVPIKIHPTIIAIAALHDNRVIFMFPQIDSFIVHMYELHANLITTISTFKTGTFEITLSGSEEQSKIPRPFGSCRRNKKPHSPSLNHIAENLIVLISFVKCIFLKLQVLTSTNTIEDKHKLSNESLPSTNDDPSKLIIKEITSNGSEEQSKIPRPLGSFRRNKKPHSPSLNHIAENLIVLISFVKCIFLKLQVLTSTNTIEDKHKYFNSRFQFIRIERTTLIPCIRPQKLITKVYERVCNKLLARQRNKMVGTNMNNNSRSVPPVLSEAVAIFSLEEVIQVRTSSQANNQPPERQL